jgi:xanthine/uracil permease
MNMNILLGYAMIITSAISLIFAAILAIDRIIYPHHPPALVTTVVFVIIGTVLVYVGMHMIAPKKENGSNLGFENELRIFIPFLLELAVLPETLLYS